MSASASGATASTTGEGESDASKVRRLERGAKGESSMDTAGAVEGEDADADIPHVPLDELLQDLHLDDPERADEAVDDEPQGAAGTGESASLHTGSAGRTEGMEGAVGVVAAVGAVARSPAQGAHPAASVQPAEGAQTEQAPAKSDKGPNTQQGESTSPGEGDKSGRKRKSDSPK